MTDTLDLDALEALEKEATPGPWEVRYVRDEVRYGVAGVALVQPDDGPRYCCISGSGGARSYTEFVYQEKYCTDESVANAKFFAAFRNAAPALIAAARREKEAHQENTHLRAALSHSKDPCVYCQLPAEEMAKCRSGFPGCGRADDMMGCPELGASLALTAAQARIAELEEALRPFADFSPPDWVPDDMQMTKGSIMAKRQLYALDFRRAARALAKPETQDTPASPG